MKMSVYLATHRNSEDPCESPAVTSMDYTSEQTDKLPRLAQSTEQASLSPERERFTPEHILVWNPSDPVVEALRRRR